MKPHQSMVVDVRLMNKYNCSIWLKKIFIYVRTVTHVALLNCILLLSIVQCTIDDNY